MSRITIPILLLLFTVLLLHCSKDRYTPLPADLTGCRDTFFTFESDVLPIMNVNCNFEECHGSHGMGSYNFTDYDVVANRVRAGTIEYRLRLPESDPQHMPEHMRLSHCDFNTIIAWIRQGYPEK